MITIRTLTVDDYDAAVAVWKDSGVKIQTTGRESRESFARQMASGLQIVLGAELDGQLVGIVLLTQDGRKGWINRLGVARSHQRQGIGKLLVEAGQKVFYDMGLTVVAALVEYGNDASLNLFKSEGFHVHDSYYVSKRSTPNA